MDTATKQKETTGVQVTAEVMLPEDVEKLVHKAFGVQLDCENESKFVNMFVFDAIVAYTKYYANAAVNDWERAIAKCQKLHKEFNREQAITFLRETSKIACQLEQVATAAEAVKKELA